MKIGVGARALGMGSAFTASADDVTAGAVCVAVPVLIWDLHCHLNGFDGRTPDEKMAEMIRYADRMGVDRLCTYMGYPFDYDPSPETLRAQNGKHFVF